MADHGGQPVVGGVPEMDITGLEVVEGGVSPLPPANILEPNVSFQLKATFSGTGNNWQNLKNMGKYFEATFYAEGIGVPPYDVNFGTANSNLDPSVDAQEIKLEYKPGLPNPGIYRVGVVITFPKGAGEKAAWHGMLGYYDGLIIQVSPLA
jgi:hypothetical protein